MCLVRVTVLATSFILVTAPALAQAPQVEKNVSMALSMAIMQGVLDQCTKDGYKVSVVIIDKGGNVGLPLAATAHLRTPWILRA
jgi:hypothetical protein